MFKQYTRMVTLTVLVILVAGCAGAKPTTTPVPPTATAIPPANTPLATPSATSTPVPPTSAPRPSDGSVFLIDSGQRLGSARSWDVELGDLDGDGDLDAFVANGMRDDESSAVWLNDGGVQGGTLGVFTVSGQDLGYGMGVGLGDIDGDGDLDALIMSWDEPGKVWFNDGAGAFVDSGQVLGDAGGWEVALGDLDGDGDLDVFAANNGSNTVWLNDGKGVFTDTGQRLGTTYTAAAGLSDLDGDGDLDAVTVGWGEPGKVWLNDGMGTFIDSEQALTPGYEHIHGMALADVNGDGALDVFMAGAPNQIWLNDGAGTFGEEIQSLPGLAGDTVAFGDLDGDGDLDAYLAVGDWTASDDKVWLNDGEGYFTDSDLSLSTDFSSGIGLGDLDGDGDQDAFVVHGELGRDSGGGIPNEVWLNETIALTNEAPPLSGSGGGVIAFTSERDGEGDIYVMNADGSDQRQLTDDPAYDAWPTWSPDGSQIAFCSDRSGNPDIYVMDADGSNVRQLTQHSANDIWPEWSPDGTRIVFPSRRDGNFEIYIINADGTNLQRLTNTPDAEDFLAWSPDSSQIFFSRTEGDEGTYVMDTDGSNERRLLDFRVFEPAWSPDGVRIAFGSDHEGFRGVYVMDADGSNLQKLSDTRTGENCPAWSPDGTRITFASWRDGDGEIYLMNADGGNLQQLTDNRSADEFPAWRPVATVASPVEAATLGDTWTRSADGMVMVYAPGGAFEMGSTEAEIETAISQCKQVRDICRPSFYRHEAPRHTVTLDGFWMDRTEVTNAQYRLCVEDGACQAPTTCDWGKPTFGDVSKADHPVGCVDWYGAQAYCEWAGVRLPTEAEWEYAARGEQGNIYPWGNTFDGARLNHCDVNCQEGSWADATVDDGYVESAPVGSYPDGASWCGALDLAGNAWEWVADWLDAYPATAQANPTGPETGSEKVMRGSSWVYDKERFRTAARDFITPTERDSPIGFRCVAAEPGE